MDRDFHDLLTILNDHYSPASIGALYAKWLRPIHQKEAIWLDEEVRQWRARRSDGQSANFDYIVILALIYSYKDLFLRLMEQLPDAVAGAFFWLAWGGEQTLPELERRLGRRLFAIEGGSAFEAARRIDVDWRFFFLDVKRKGRTYAASLWLPQAVRRLIRPYLQKPPGYWLEGSDTRPDAAFFFAERDIASLLPRCLSFVARGGARFSRASRRLLSSALKKFHRDVRFPEFYPGDLERYGYVRGQLTLLFLAQAAVDRGGLEDDVKDQLNGLCAAYFRGSDAFGLNAMTHLRGRGVSQPAAGEGCGGETADTVRTVLENMPASGWVAIEDVLEFCRFRELRAPAYRPGPPWPDVFVGVQSAIDGETRPERVFISERNYDELVAVPLLKAHLFLLAGFGLLEVAYDRPRNPAYRLPGDAFLTPYDGLAHFRLTELGAAVLGRGETAALTGAAGGAPPILDEGALIVTLAADDPDLRAVLEQFARPLSRNRYKVDFTSFFKGARDKAAVQATIQMFRQLVCREPPSLWEDFFEAALIRVDPLSPEPGWQVFTLRNDPELLAAFQRDPVLRQLAVRAADLRVLIRPRDWGKVKKKLEERGYLITI